MSTVLHESQAEMQKKSNSLVNIFRIIVGVLFIFSGLIKANDPNGLAFKMQEFFSHWDVTQFNSSTYFLSIVIIVFEILAGVAILIGYATRLITILLIALMVFFLFLTGYAVYFELKNGVELKCGCFGDCIPLTAWQSFWKDVILLVMTIYLFLKRDYIKNMFSLKSGHIFMLVSTVVVGMIIFFALRNLPYVDCLPFKVGNHMSQLYADKDRDDKVEFNYVFNIDGKKVIKTNEEFMNDASLHSTPYEDIIEKVIEKAPSHAAIMRDYIVTEPASGIDFAPSLFSETDNGYYFVWYIRDVKDMNMANIDRIKAIQAESLKGTQVGVVVVTSSNIQDVRAFLQQQQIPINQIFSLNEKSMKTTVRSNPGLILLNKGKILGKWSPAKYPSSYSFDGEVIKLN